MWFSLLVECQKIVQIEEEIDTHKEVLVAYRVFVQIHTNKKKTTGITRNTRKGENEYR